ncbi:hypothetical protein FLM52_10730 [bacterium Scap17]|nr:hypothetical protein [bacterium Scap17]
MSILRKWISPHNKFIGDTPKSIKLYLHIGSPKAGSSALQKFMLHTCNSLAKFGYYYPEHGADQNGVSGGHGQLASALRENNLESATLLLNKWMSHARKKNMKLVLSSESFFNQAQAFHTLLHEKLGLEPETIRVISFVRAPIDYLMGNYNQGIKRHDATWRLSSHLAQVMSTAKHSRAGIPLIQWAHYFGDDNCHFITYHKPSVDQPQIESLFLKALGMTLSNIKTLLPERTITNRSYVRSALELKRILNTVLDELPPKIGREIDRALQAYSDQHPEEDSLGSQDIPGPLYQEINDMFLSAMEPVMQRFPSLDRDVLFPPQGKKRARTAELCNPYRPLSYLEAQCPKELDAIKEEALSQYQSGSQGYAFLKLLDLLGLDFEEPDARTGLSARARGIIASSKMKEADRLRELGAYFEQQGLLDDALLLLQKALEARPGGGGIKKMQRRIADKKLVLEQINSSDASCDDITAH